MERPRMMLCQYLRLSDVATCTESIMNMIEKMRLRTSETTPMWIQPIPKLRRNSFSHFIARFFLFPKSSYELSEDEEEEEESEKEETVDFF